MPKRELSWQPGYTLSRKPAKRPTRRRNQQHRFEIIVEQPQTVHRDETEQASTTAAQNLGLSQNGSLHGASASGESVDYNDLPIDQSLEASKSSSGLSHLTEGTCGPQDVVLSGPDTTPLAALPSTSSPSLALMSPVLSTVQYTSLTERFRPILTQCMRNHILVAYNQLIFSRQYRVLHNPTDIQAAYQSISLSYGPRPGAPVPGPRRHGVGGPPCQERVHVGAPPSSAAVATPEYMLSGRYRDHAFRPRHNCDSVLTRCQFSLCFAFLIL